MIRVKKAAGHIAQLYGDDPPLSVVDGKPIWSMTFVDVTGKWCDSRAEGSKRF